MIEQGGGDAGPLIGVIDAGTRTVKFCVFASQHTKEIAEHAIDVKRITPREGWSEQDPLEILKAIRECIERVLEILGPRGEIVYVVCFSTALCNGYK